MSSDSTASCPSNSYFGAPVKPVVGDHTFHDLSTYIGGACTVISVILCFGLSFMHLCTYRVRSEQRQIARIVLTPAVVSIFVWIGLKSYPASGYVKPIGEYYDALTLVALFLLFVTYATPVERRGGPSALLDNVPNLDASHVGMQAKIIEMNLFYRCWVFVFQIVPIRFILMIVEMAADGSVCKQLEKHNRDVTIVTAISTISTVMCFVAVLRLMKMVKPSLADKRAFMKTIALKGLVGITVLLNLVFSILKSANALHPSDTMDLMDLYIALPNLITCCVGLIFSILITIPFLTTPYTARAMPGVEKHSFFVALFDVLNFTDILFVGMACMIRAFAMWHSGRSEPAQSDAEHGKIGRISLPYYRTESDTYPSTSQPAQGYVRESRQRD